MPTKSWRGANPKSDPTKNMVVIYHGIAMPAHMLEEVVDTLVAYARILQVKVVCFNYRGYGYSDHPSTISGAQECCDQSIC